MDNPYSFLLIGNKDSLWYRRILSILTPQDVLYLASTEEYKDHIYRFSTNLVIIDSFSVKSVKDLVISIRKIRNDLFFLILDNGDESGKTALEVFRAGGGHIIDYIPVTISDTNLHQIIIDFKFSSVILE